MGLWPHDLFGCNDALEVAMAFLTLVGIGPEGWEDKVTLLVQSHLFD